MRALSLLLCALVVGVACSEHRELDIALGESIDANSGAPSAAQDKQPRKKTDDRDRLKALESKARSATAKAEKRIKKTNTAKPAKVTRHQGELPRSDLKKGGLETAAQRIRARTRRSVAKSRQKPRTDPMVRVTVKTHPTKAAVTFPLLHLTMKTKKGIGSVQVSPTASAVGSKVRAEARNLKAQRKQSDKSTMSQFPLLNKVLANTGKAFGNVRTSSVSRGESPSSKRSMSVVEHAVKSVEVLNAGLNKVSKAQRTWVKLKQDSAKSERKINEANRRITKQNAQRMKAAERDIWRRIHKTVTDFDSRMGLRKGRTQVKAHGSEHHEVEQLDED